MQSFGESRIVHGRGRVGHLGVEAAEYLLVRVVVALAVSAREIGVFRGLRIEERGSLRRIWFGELRWPIQSSSGRSWFQITPHFVPKISI